MVEVYAVGKSQIVHRLRMHAYLCAEIYMTHFDITSFLVCVDAL
jgi:hypothetical protein